MSFRGMEKKTLRTCLTRCQSIHILSYLQTEETSNNTNDDRLNGNISTEEIKAALRRLHDKKAEEIDDNPAEILKNQNLLSLIAVLFNQYFILGKIPNLWKTGIIAPVLKSLTTDKRDPRNYSGMTITPQCTDNTVM